jgi:hypothetical protein
MSSRRASGPRFCAPRSDTPTHSRTLPDSFGYRASNASSAPKDASQQPMPLAAYPRIARVSRQYRPFAGRVRQSIPPRITHFVRLPNPMAQENTQGAGSRTGSEGGPRG